MIIPVLNGYIISEYCIKMFVISLIHIYFPFSSTEENRDG